MDRLFVKEPSQSRRQVADHQLSSGLGLTAGLLDGLAGRVDPYETLIHSGIGQSGLVNSQHVDLRTIKTAHIQRDILPVPCPADRRYLAGS